MAWTDAARKAAAAKRKAGGKLKKKSTSTATFPASSLRGKTDGISLLVGPKGSARQAFFRGSKNVQGQGVSAPIFTKSPGGSKSVRSAKTLLGTFKVKK